MRHEDLPGAVAPAQPRFADSPSAAQWYAGDTAPEATCHRSLREAVVSALLWVEDSCLEEKTLSLALLL